MSTTAGRVDGHQRRCPLGIPCNCKCGAHNSHYTCAIQQRTYQCPNAIYLSKKDCLLSRRRRCIFCGPQNGGRLNTRPSARWRLKDVYDDDGAESRCYAREHSFPYQNDAMDMTLANCTVGSLVSSCDASRRKQTLSYPATVKNCSESYGSRKTPVEWCCYERKFRWLKAFHGFPSKSMFLQLLLLALRAFHRPRATVRNPSWGRRLKVSPRMSREDCGRVPLFLPPYLMPCRLHLLYVSAIVTWASRESCWVFYAISASAIRHVEVQQKRLVMKSDWNL